MAKRDPELTARNKRIEAIGAELKALLPQVLKKTGIASEGSLHGKIGGKNALFIKIKQEVIYAPEQFISLWLEGLMQDIEVVEGPWAISQSQAHVELAQLIQNDKDFRDYVLLFLERTFLREFSNLAKSRPDDEAHIWIGENDAEYGIFITPRFRNGQWENDKSEIRKLKHRYWSVGHVLESGLVIPGKDKRLPFSSLEQLLTFYEVSLVRSSGSVHEQRVAERYCKYVLSHAKPLGVPFLVPQYRYAGLEKQHVYRLDFCVIDPFSLARFGFELSPWSSHGQLKKIAGMTQKAINKIAQRNFERELRKAKDYFRKHNVAVRIYTDEDLKNPDAVFEEIRKHLEGSKPFTQLKFNTITEFLRFKIPR